ncbi:MAG: Asp-tRNA(Asn)/Glu-tRNA(Gln) amidotransferase subunit GatC [Firmicutes bacterium]|nr:Asp-tRNA(Asn)/Glu-tRNA(Gln) amidotransferase subunit GatC [Bacillota bacterium]
MTLQELEELAATARLGLTDLEKQMLPEQISRILACVEMLQSVDTTTGVAPTVYPIMQPGLLREDKITPSLSRDAALANGPEVEDNCFRVPRVIEED